MFATRSTSLYRARQKKMAKMERAPAIFEIRVDGAASEAEASALAMTSRLRPGENGPYGKIPTGAVLAAAAVPGWRRSTKRVDIYFGRLCLYRQGTPTASPRRGPRAAEARDVITIRVHQGKARVCIDLRFTGQYVDINARYRT